MGKILWRREWQPTQVFLPGEFHGQRSLAGYSPWGRRSRTRLSNLYTHTHTHKVPLDFPWWLSGKESACQGRRCRFNPWDGKIPWWRKWQPTPVFLPGKSHGQRSLAGYHPWGHKRVRSDLATRQQHGALNVVDTCYDLNVRVSPNLTWRISYCWCDGITRWGLERNSGHEGGALLNWINVFIKETPESSLTLATVWRPNEKVQADCEPGRRPSPKRDHARSLILGFPAPRIVRNKCLLLINYSVNSILLQPLQKTKIILKRKIHLVNKKEKIKFRKIRRNTSTFPSTKHNNCKYFSIFPSSLSLW